MYETVASELESVLAAWDYQGRTRPAFVTRRLRGYLRCGRTEWGFTRVYCSTCRADSIVALSCKDRGICPSCTGRRMSSTAANLVQRVIPEQDVRQYVLTVPYQLRARLVYNPEDNHRAIDLWTRTLLEFIHGWAKLEHGRHGEGGSVTFVQRCSSDLRLNLHYHTIALDGVYTPEFEFMITPPPDDDCLLELLREVVRRFETAFLSESDDSCVDPDDPLPSIYGAAVTGRSATLGQRRGRKAAELGAFQLVPYEADDGIVSHISTLLVSKNMERSMMRL